MNETLQSIHARYSCRNFTGEQPGDEALQAIAQAALAAPSAMNRQLWRVIVLKDRALIAELEAEGSRVIMADPDRGAWERIMARGGRLFYNAPCMIVVPIDAREYPGSAALDCGILAQTVAVAAASLGVDSCICGLAGLAFYDGARGDAFKQRLGFPEGYTHGMSILLGYAKTPGGKPHPADMSKISVIG